MKRIIYTTSDSDNVCIVIPADDMFNPSSRTRQALPELAEASDEDILNYIIQKDVTPKNPNNIKIVEEEDIPGHRFFRNCWELNRDYVEVNIEKARDTRMEEIRGLRNEALKSLDVEYIKADEAGDSVKKKEIATKKQELRDIPKTFDLSAVTDVAQLAEILPDILT